MNALENNFRTIDTSDTYSSGHLERMIDKIIQSKSDYFTVAKAVFPYKALLD